MRKNYVHKDEGGQSEAADDASSIPDTPLQNLDAEGLPIENAGRILRANYQALNTDNTAQKKGRYGPRGKYKKRQAKAIEKEISVKEETLSDENESNS